MPLRVSPPQLPLRQFKATPPAHEQNVFREWQPFLLHGPAHNFVHGIVASDVFAHLEQFATGRKEPSGVQASRLLEDDLIASQTVAESAEDFRRDLKIGIWPSQSPSANGRNRFAATMVPN